MIDILYNNFINFVSATINNPILKDFYITFLALIILNVIMFIIRNILLYCIYKTRYNLMYKRWWKYVL